MSVFSCLHHLCCSECKSNLVHVKDFTAKILFHLDCWLKWLVVFFLHSSIILLVTENMPLCNWVFLGECHFLIQKGYKRISIFGNLSWTKLCKKKRCFFTTSSMFLSWTKVAGFESIKVCLNHLCTLHSGIYFLLPRNRILGIKAVCPEDKFAIYLQMKNERISGVPCFLAKALHRKLTTLSFQHKALMMTLDITCSFG